MMKLYKNTLFFITLCCLNNHAIADKNLHFLNPKNTVQIASIEPLKNKLQSILSSKFTATASIKNPLVSAPLSSINISFGINALEKSLEKAYRVDIATLLTQAEITSLIQKYPEQLRNTQIILNGSLFQCQLALFKKNNPSENGSNPTLGILLTRESSVLLSEVESYAQKHSIKVDFLILKYNESVIRGFRYLMQQYATVMMIADNRFNKLDDLEIIFYQGKLMNKKIIGSTVSTQSNVNQKCVINDEKIITKVIEVTNNQLKGITLAKLNSLIPGYQVFLADND